MGDDITEKLAEALDLGEADDLGFEPVFEAVGGTVVVRNTEDPNTVVLGYLSHDPDPMPFFESDDGAGEFARCRSVAQVEDAMAAARRERKVALLVEKYEHGDVHYSVASTKDYPDRRWDVAPAGVYVPNDDLQAEYRAAVRRANKEIRALDAADPARAAREADLKAAPLKALAAASNRVLDSYSDWCNGQVFGAVTEVVRWDAAANALERVGDEDAVWGYIGHEHAEESLEAAVQEVARRLETEREAAPKP